MNPVGSSLIDRAHFLAQAGEVRRQDRWGNEQRASHHDLVGLVRRARRPAGPAGKSGSRLT
jgi:hypothetical protein